MKVQWKDYLEWSEQAPRISNSRELIPTSGLKAKRDKRLLNPRESYSYRRSSGRSYGLWNKENGVTKTQRELEQQKQDYLPNRSCADGSPRREEAGGNKYPTIFLSCLRISSHVSWYQDSVRSQIAKEIRWSRLLISAPEVCSRLRRAVKYTYFMSCLTFPWPIILSWPLLGQLAAAIAPGLSFTACLLFLRNPLPSPHETPTGD